MNRGYDVAAQSARPAMFHRLSVAIEIGIAAAAMHYSGAARNQGLSDFSILWHGSRILSSGGNPYSMIGPQQVIDLPSSVFYPAPALVAVMPFSLIPMQLAGTLFVFLSAALLAFGATKDGWHRIPIFPSVAFMTSARLGQSSALICASVFIPAMAFFSVVKPQASIPILSAATKPKSWIFAIIGTTILSLVSFLLLPEWPQSWWETLRSADYFRPPILTVVGAPIALVLLRWRRPEAWLVFVAACLPQTWYPYNGLILLTVAATYREASALSLISSFGWLIAYGWFVGDLRSPETRTVMQNVLIALGYLPATIVILRRKNEGPEPLWMRWAVRRYTHQRTHSQSATTIVSS